MPINLDAIPKLPGCYIFKNKKGEIIYIGKSKLLHSRVRSYFSPGRPKDDKYAALAREAREVETVVTETETDALILECRLIKEHRPKYNSQLKRDRAFPFIRVGVNDEFPPITVAESTADDGAAYYGNFYNRDGAIAAIDLIGGIWRTPVCLKERFAAGKPERPCLNYHLGKCCAPCGGMVGAGEYRQKITELSKCLRGDFKNAERGLKREMNGAAKALDFERAAAARDRIAGLNLLKKKQRRLCADLAGKDAYLFFRAFNEQRYTIFFIRDGAVLRRLDLPDLEPPDGGALGRFVRSASGEAVADGGFLTSCVLEIAADKLFTVMPKRAGADSAVRKLLAAHGEFIYSPDKKHF